MKFQTIGAVCSVAAAALSSAAFAQTAPAPAETGAAITGPAIPNVCILSREVIVTNSTVGQYVVNRLQQITAQVNAELTSERTALETEARTLEGQASTLQQNALQQRAQALQERIDAFQQKTAQRDQELAATEQKAVSRVFTEASPLVNEVVNQRACGLVLDASTVLAGNVAMDVTPAVIERLNAKITQFPFEREQLPAQPAAAAAQR